MPAGKATPEVLAISFLDAINRGLKQNLGLLLSSDNTVAARGAKWKELSSLLPNVEAKGLENAQELSAATLGIPLPGIPRVIGPFNYLDMRAFLTQSIFNWNYIQKERSVESLKAAEYTYKDAANWWCWWWAMNDCRGCPWQHAIRARPNRRLQHSPRRNGALVVFLRRILPDCRNRTG